MPAAPPDSHGQDFHFLNEEQIEKCWNFKRGFDLKPGPTFADIAHRAVKQRPSAAFANDPRILNDRSPPRPPAVAVKIMVNGSRHRSNLACNRGA